MKQRASTYIFLLGLISTAGATTNNNAVTTQTNTKNSLVVKGNANAGFTFSNTVQQQTYLDNYPNDYGNGPLSSADFTSTLMLYDSADSVSILDIRNTYFDKIKTDTAGIGIVYRYKPKKGTLLGINAAYDYTDYNGMYFSQIAVGAETNYQDFDAIFNFYIPKGGSSTYDKWTSGSTLRGLYGGDLTLLKKHNNLQASIMGSYHFHDDVKDNISAVTIGGGYHTSSMFGIGASYQYRRGLDSSDTGYKLYTKIPLFRSTQRNNHNEDMYAPARRQLGPVIQYVKDDACEDNGFETFAAYGINHCGGLNPFDSAYLKSGLSLRERIKLGENLIDMSGRDFVAKTKKIYHITSPTHFKSITIEPGSMVIIGPNVQLFTTGTFTSGSETGSTNPALILSEASLRSYALNTKASGLSSMAKKFSDYTNSYTNLGSAIIVTSTAGSLNAATASTDTTRVQENIQTADFYANYFHELTHTASAQGSRTTTISPRSGATNPLIKKMTQIGSGTNAEDNTIINSVHNTLIDGPTLVTMGANNWIKDSVIKANKQLAIYGGVTSLEANIIKSPALANSTIEMAFGAQVLAYANTMVSNDVYKDHVTLKLPTSHHQNSKAEITKDHIDINNTVAQNYRWANQQLLSNFNVYYTTNGVRNSIINLMDQHGVGLGYEISSVNDKVILGSYAKNSSDTINWTFGGMDLSDLSDTGYRATASEHSDHNIQNMSIFIDGFTD
ncbi:MAG: hypothetical protein VX737_06395, partial [Pseudomonadota bacterium]|nr:hypothetical protein [Pseudomonadota bacterium]